MKKQIVTLAIIATLTAFGSWGCSTLQSASAPIVLNGLTKEDIALVLPKLAPPQALAQLAGNPEQIELLLKQLKEVLSVAAEARKTGVAAEPEVKQQLDFVASQVIAVGYDREQNKAAAPGVKPFADVKPEDVEAFYKEASNETKLNSLIETIKKQYADSQPPGAPAPPPISETQLTQIREQYAKTLLTERKARAAGFEKKRETELQVGLQQASYLALEYGKRKDKEFDPNDADLAAYVAAHPEFDTTKQREKAEDVLKRAQAGEDFAKLANEFSEDPGNKDPKDGKSKGGLYEDVKKGMFQPAFEQAALALEPGKIVPQLVETPFGYHVIKLENKKTAKSAEGTDEETYSVRHILISTAGKPNPQNPMGQPKGLKDQARDAVKKEKRDKWIEEIEARNPITLPKADEVKIEAPALPPPPGAGIGGGPQELPPPPPSEGTSAPPTKDGKK